VWGVSCGALWSEARGVRGALSGDIMIGGHCVVVMWYCGIVVLWCSLYFCIIVCIGENMMTRVEVW
jgi:hypothetical protein